MLPKTQSATEEPRMVRSTRIIMYLQKLHKRWIQYFNATSGKYLYACHLPVW